MALKNIRFRSFGAQVLTIQPQARILIEWELEPTAQNLQNLKFFVDRGESPSEMAAISVAISPYELREYVDFSSRLIDVNKVYYYRIRAVEYLNNIPLQTFTSEPFTWDGKIDLVAKYMIEEHLFAFQYVFGVPTLIYKRRREGLHCPECFDLVLKRSTKSNCLTCLGTGWVKGFYNPIEQWVEIGQRPDSPTTSERGETQNSKTNLLMANYPIVRDGDLIVELEPNKYWKVVEGQASEKQKSPVLQRYTLSEVSRNDIEYRVDVDQETRRRLVDQLRDRRTKGEF